MGHVAWRLAAKKIPEYAWLSIICGQSALEWGIDSSASAYQWVGFSALELTAAATPALWAAAALLVGGSVAYAAQCYMRCASLQ